MAWVVVGLVVLPNLEVEVYIHDQQPVSRQLLVPFHLLPVLQHVVFVAMAIVIHDVGVAAFLQRLHVGNNGVCLQFDGFKPTSHPTLVAGVAGWAVAVTIIASSRHQIPDIQAYSTTVVDVVEVGESKTVAELMTQCADATDATTAVELAATGIGVDGYAIELDRSVAVTT